MFRIISPPENLPNRPLLVRNRGYIIAEYKVYAIPPFATHIGAKLGILRFLHPQNDELEIPQGFFGPTGAHWRYWPIPNDAKKVSFPFLVVPHQDTYNIGLSPWFYGEPEFA